jgi:hypothetical protein
VFSPAKSFKVRTACISRAFIVCCIVPKPSPFTDRLYTRLARATPSQFLCFSFHPPIRSTNLALVIYPRGIACGSHEPLNSKSSVLQEFTYICFRWYLCRSERPLLTTRCSILKWLPSMRKSRTCLSHQPRPLKSRSNLQSPQTHSRRMK